MENTRQIDKLEPNSGAYVEGKCVNVLCKDYKKKIFIWVGSNFNFDFFEICKDLKCSHCFTVYSFLSIGFYMAKWVYQGQLCNGETLLGKTQVFLEYQDSAEIKNKTWNWLQIRVQSLSETIVSTYNLLRSSRENPNQKNGLISSGPRGILENIQDYIKPLS